MASSGPISVVAGTLNSRTPGPLLPGRPPSTVARGHRYGSRSIYRRRRPDSYSRVARRTGPRPGGRSAAVSLPPMADQSTQSIVVDAPAADVMAVIADFPAYPQWAASVKKAEVLEEGDGGRARRVRFAIDQAMIRDEYVLEYTWDGERTVSWRLVEGQMQKRIDGSYTFAERDGSTE